MALHTVRGDQIWRHGWSPYMAPRMVLGGPSVAPYTSGGTICSATDSPGGQHLGGTDYRVTGVGSWMQHVISRTKSSDSLVRC